MFTPKTRLLIILGCTILIVISLYQNKIYAAVAVLCFVCITLYGYIKQGTVYLAYKHLRKGEHEKAEEVLAQTRKINWLSKTQRAYYHFVDGFLLLAKGKLEDSKSAYEEAIKIGLRLSNDTAMTYANLASIHHRQKNKVKAREYIQKTKGLKINKNTQTELDRLEIMIG